MTGPIRSDGWDVGRGASGPLPGPDGKQTVLVDGDVILYRVAAMMENDQDAIEAFENTRAPARRKHFIDRAVQEFWAVVSEWVQGATEHAPGTDSVRVYLTDAPDQYRYALAVTKPYKGNRKGDKPMYFQDLSAEVKKDERTVVATTCEADDLMSIEQCSRIDFVELSKPVLKQPTGSVIVTVDKDLLQVPGHHFNPDKGEFYRVGDTVGEIWGEYSEDGKTLKHLRGYGFLLFLAQLIMGDPTDNIPGLPRKGMVAALEALESLSHKPRYYALGGVLRVQAMYTQKYGLELGVDVMTEQGNLLWMQRYPGELWREYSRDYIYENLHQVAVDLPQAQRLCAEIYAESAQYRIFPALTGGVLYKPGSRKDVDVAFYKGSDNDADQGDCWDTIDKCMVAVGALCILDSGGSVRKYIKDGMIVDVFNLCADRMVGYEED